MPKAKLRLSKTTTYWASYGLRILLVARFTQHQLELARIPREHQLFCLFGCHLNRHGLYFRWLALVVA